jgi:hypothetical protein
MDIANILEYLYFTQLEFKIRFLEDTHLPIMKGSTFRGGFGYIFKKLTCPLRKDNCIGCIISNSCPYANVFTNPSGINKETFISENSYTPHPFVFDFYENEKLKMTSFKKNETFEFRFLIIGTAIRFLPYFVYSFIELGKKGIGKEYYKYELESVKVKDKEIYNYKTGKILNDFEKIDFYHNILNEEDNYLSKLKRNSNISLFNPTKISTDENILLENKKDYKLSLNFITPVRIKKDRRYTEFIDFNILITNIIRRLYLLTILFCIQNDSDKYQVSNLKEYLNSSYQVKNLNNYLSWYDWSRYSTRQKTTMKLGGLVGQISFIGKGEFLNNYLKPLFACEYLHVGKGTSFGLGKYEIKEITELN